MARPGPEIYLECQDSSSTERIVSGEGFWLVVWRELPINIIHESWPGLRPNRKYIRTGFANRAHADNLARRLNKRYMTDEFTVKAIEFDKR